MYFTPFAAVCAYNWTQITRMLLHSADSQSVGVSFVLREAEWLKEALITIELPQKVQISSTFWQKGKNVQWQRVRSQLTFLYVEVSCSPCGFTSSLFFIKSSFDEKKTWEKTDYTYYYTYTHSHFLTRLKRWKSVNKKYVNEKHKQKQNVNCDGFT